MNKEDWIEESIQKYIAKVGIKVDKKDLQDMYKATEGYADAAIDIRISTDSMANILYNLYLRGFGKEDHKSK